jgi:Domain of unknown function (DUF3470)
VCEPECPAKAIKPDTESGLDDWLALNARYAPEWPNVTEKKNHRLRLRPSTVYPENSLRISRRSRAKEREIVGRSVTAHDT